MFRNLVLALGLIVSVSASASTINTVIRDLNTAVLTDAASKGTFNWVVGDTASYNLKVSFISGKMIMTIKAVSASEVVIGQDMDLGFAGKQSCDTTINSSTGQVEKMVCNGEEQAPPEQGDVEVVESKEDTVKVPAGTFVCLYIKANSTTDGKVTEIQQWANPKLVPVMGLVKAITPSQLGAVNVELTSFKKM